ncbi:hypothetical protein BIFANG_03434 [Bifidobacterium angulatum DSM 20098 = JCM 7096]|uniref:Uncharacterized protein n=1 Tax=Bifidobacterium angulatum DSM 20098 = JCM 7096 TaxID=518635 RepID=C4FGG4_9BIFI|nr:hypothetical protein BIFANG_03434 [Bifidobacterium angulatum DSM 20098 = JCM 7096]
MPDSAEPADSPLFMPARMADSPEKDTAAQAPPPACRTMRRSA